MSEMKVISGIAAAVGAGVLFKYVSTQSDKHVLESMVFTSDPAVAAVHGQNKLDIQSHPVLKHDPSFQNKDGLIIRTKHWIPQGGEEPKGVVFVVHGYAEHAGRYNHVVEHLLDIGLEVYALDHQGHGRSEGEKLYVREFDDFVDDVLQLVHSVKLKSGQKRFLLGHSMGGLISTMTASRVSQAR